MKFIVWLFFIGVALVPDNINATSYSYDGFGNNELNPTWGKTGLPISRYLGARNVTLSLPYARDVTNGLFSERSFKNSGHYSTEERLKGLSPNTRKLNVLINGFHQLVGHDMSMVRLSSCFSPQCFILSPITDTNDPLYMTVQDTPGLRVSRTLLFVPKGEVLYQDGSPYMINDQTSYLDGSVFYGPSESVTNSLRQFTDGLLKLKTDVADPEFPELPNSAQTGTPNQCSAFGPFGLASGDPRTETNSVLASLHTLFAREHNRLAKQFKTEDPNATDDELFQRARKWVIALFQHIVVDEFSREQFGTEQVSRDLGRYQGYNPSVDTTVWTEFAVSANRIPHDQVNLPMLVLDKNGNRLQLPGTQGFETIERINCIADKYWEFGTDAILRGNLAQYAQEFDGKCVDDVRSFPARISTPLPYNFDIKVMDLEREREARVESYYHIRKQVTGDDLYTFRGCYDAQTHDEDGVIRDPLDCFKHITHNVTAATIMREMYKKIDNVDFHVGMMYESIRTTTGFPLTASKLWLNQIKRSRDGDRLWFENYKENGLFTQSEYSEIKSTTMRDIILRNTNLDRKQVKSSAFHVSKIDLKN